MPWYRMRLDLGGPLAGGAFHVKADRRLVTPRCSVCGYVSSRQCDWRLRLGVQGEPVTCDRWLCSFCTVEPAPGKDLCPEHVGAWKARLAARTNSVDGAGP